MACKSKHRWTAGGLSLGGLLGVWILLGVQAEAMATAECATQKWDQMGHGRGWGAGRPHCLWSSHALTAAGGPPGDSPASHSQPRSGRGGQKLELVGESVEHEVSGTSSWASMLPSEGRTDQGCALGLGPGSQWSLQHQCGFKF